MIGKGKRQGSSATEALLTVALIIGTVVALFLWPSVVWPILAWMFGIMFVILILVVVVVFAMNLFQKSEPRQQTIQEQSNVGPEYSDRTDP